jgi:ATP-binding cassette subfamily B protein
MGPRRGPRGKKPKFNIVSFKKILKYMKPYNLAIIFAIILAILSAIATIIGPDKIKELTDEISSTMMTGINLDNVMKIALSLITLYGMSAILGYSQQFIMATVTQKTANRLRSDMDKKLYLLPLAFFDKNSRGEILSKVTNDVDTIAQTLSSSIANLFSSIVLFFGILIMMFVTNWVLAIVTIVTSSLGVILMPIIMGKSQKFFVGNQMLLGKMNGQIEEIYTNHNVVKAFNAISEEKNKFNETNNNLKESNWKSQFI